MSVVKCSNCGTDSKDGQLTCENCGNLLFSPSVSTVHMKIDPALLRLRRDRQSTPTETYPEHMVVFQIRGMVERIAFEDGTELILGRSDLSVPGGSRLDLSRYGAHDRGVSREHAVLRFTNGQLTLTDLESVNGTSVNMTKLQPKHPHALKSGDEIMLGTLSIVVNFELPVAPKNLPPVPTGADETVPISRKSLALKMFSDSVAKHTESGDSSDDSPDPISTADLPTGDMPPTTPPDSASTTKADGTPTE
jgi:hypothetical protein